MMYELDKKESATESEKAEELYMRNTEKDDTSKSRVNYG